MSIETALEKYPKEITLKDGSKCVLRPLVRQDAKALNEFFLSLPGFELMFFRQSVTDHAVLKQMCEHIDPARNLLLLAIKDKKIIGECTLRQQQGGWKRHIGDVTAHVHPGHREKGLGRLMISEMIEIARASGLHRLEAEFLSKQESAMKMFAILGFSELMRLQDYVKDLQAVTHDYVLMGMRIITDEEYAGMG